jgi:hypothetical protein
MGAAKREKRTEDHAVTTATASELRATIEAVLAAPDAAQALRARRIALLVHRPPLAVRGRAILGAWDPLLRRIELFDADRRTDAQLTATLVHELLHALGGPADEPRLHARAASIAADRPPAALAACAARLRAAARGAGCPVKTHRAETAS